MTDLIPICALGQPQPQTRRIGALRLSEQSDLGLASLALPQGAASPNLGLALPVPGGWAGAEGLAAFWTGPGQWMVEYPGRAGDDVADELAAKAPGARITEQTDAFAGFLIEGPPDHLLRLMQRLVNLDPRQFGPGRATRTGFHHMSVFVIRRAADQLAVLGMRSTAGTVWHALIQAATRQQESA